MPVAVEEAVAGRELLERGHEAAGAGCLWHGFGDVNLLLPRPARPGHVASRRGRGARRACEAGHRTYVTYEGA